MAGVDAAMRFQHCEDLDPDGSHELLCFRGLSFEAQDELFRSVFPAGCEGEAGGLMTVEERAKWKELGESGEYTVESCFGKKWHVRSEEVVSLGDMGFHGRHHLLLKDCAACQSIVELMQLAAPRCATTRAPEFRPEYVAVSYENLGGRIIKGTLCGTAYDDDRCSKRGEVGDGTPKAFLFLGRAAVTVGFKYDKADRQWLRVRMAPGDCLLRFGSARAWCMGVLKIDNTAPEGRGEKNPCPCDFVHVKLMDHRRLRQERPDLFARCHAKRIDPKEDKFNMNPGCFQYAYTILGPDVPGLPIKCRVLNDNKMLFAAVSSSGTFGHGVTTAQACYADVSEFTDRSRGRHDIGGRGYIACTDSVSSPPKGNRFSKTSVQAADGIQDPPRRRWKAKAQQPAEEVQEALLAA
eukprot:TRINITY_DN46693_c0_g1_i1.p1 TRINITY_DN46693_c0_g1~~TRINITY_DN46693_c0_g1_i1.p1  ORF type:complete len:408 (-),score=57.73 TRINITY_DN46693_c0_g1_i1:204-1427(-)